MDTNDKGLEASILYAKQYLSDLLSFFGLNVEIHATTEDEQVIELNVPTTHMNGFLIGNHGDNMRSFQYLISMALNTNGYEVVRVNVDIADYKKQRASRLEDRAQAWLQEVKDTGVSKHLEPMNPADRRTIHRLAGENGVETVSEGVGRERHIVLLPAVQDDIDTSKPAVDKNETDTAE